MGLSCVGPLIRRFFSVVKTTVLHDLRLVEPTDVELRIQRASYQLCVDFLTAQRVGIPNSTCSRVNSNYLLD